MTKPAWHWVFWGSTLFFKQETAVRDSLTRGGCWCCMLICHCSHVNIPSCQWWFVHLICRNYTFGITPLWSGHNACLSHEIFVYDNCPEAQKLHVNFSINTSSKGGRLRTQPAHVSPFSVPTCRVSPTDERGDGRGGRVHLLTGHLRPGEQWLRQLLHQTGALRSRHQDRAGRNWFGTFLWKIPCKNREHWESISSQKNTQTNATGRLRSQYQRWRWGGEEARFHSSEKLRSGTIF